MIEAEELVAKPAVSVRRYGGLALRIGISTAILGWLSTRVDWAHVVEAFRGLKWGYWLAAFGVYIVCQLLCCVRWLLLSRPLGFQQSVGRFTAIYFVGMFFNLFLPTSIGGDAVRVLYLAKGGQRKLMAFLSVFMDRMSGLIVLIAMACLALMLCPVELPPEIRFSVWGLGAMASFGMLGLPLIIKLTRGVTLTGEGLGTRTAARIRRLSVGTEQAIDLFRRRPAMLASIIVISVVVQVLNAALVWLVGLALQLDVPPVYYGVAAPMVTLLTMIPLSLNGVGLREGGMVLFLGPAGVSAAAAVSVAFLWFSVQTVASLIGAGVYLFGHFSRPEGESGEGSAIDRDSSERRTGEYLSVA